MGVLSRYDEGRDELCRVGAMGGLGRYDETSSEETDSDSEQILDCTVISLN